jgi:hypothetical protein
MFFLLNSDAVGDVALGFPEQEANTESGMADKRMECPLQYPIASGSLRRVLQPPVSGLWVSRRRDSGFRLVRIVSETFKTSRPFER